MQNIYWPLHQVLHDIQVQVLHEIMEPVSCLQFLYILMVCGRLTFPLGNVKKIKNRGKPQYLKIILHFSIKCVKKLRTAEYTELQSRLLYNNCRKIIFRWHYCLIAHVRTLAMQIVHTIQCIYIEISIKIGTAQSNAKSSQLEFGVLRMSKTFYSNYMLAHVNVHLNQINVHVNSSSGIFNGN